MSGPRSEISEDWASVVRRAKGLDAAAFEEIVDAYAGRLYGFFQRMLGGREEAEDLVQEVFVRVVKAIAEYREEGRFEAWLFRIAGNLVRDRLRREPRESALGTSGQDDALDLESRTDRCTGDAQDTLERSEDADRLQKCLTKLPTVEREVILMRHYGELSFAEIAEYTAAPLGTVLSRAHRGLAKLRQWMESPT
jgi:RNA polymerase sigma-70 factor (ECF subfamily)